MRFLYEPFVLALRQYSHPAETKKDSQALCLKFGVKQDKLFRHFGQIGSMKTRLILLLLLSSRYLFAQVQFPTLFEQSKGNQTPEYEAVIQYFESLAKASDQLKIIEMGITDAGLPLHVLLYDPKGDFDPAVWHSENRLVLFINNGIHPGEPDGIDASMMLLRDMITGKVKVPKDLAMAMVPVYNIGGHLNRNSFSRVNQNGPESYGFRANARNYDLNRDFIKADTKNARSFHQLFHWLKPHVFIDTHVSNGADYQHVMTLIATQHNRLGGAVGEYLHQEMEPQLNSRMKEKGFPMVPYVNAWSGKPEDGWSQFKDSGRYSSGYAALFSTLSFMPETHMLKPYADRVASTYALFISFFDIIEKDSKKIVSKVQADRKAQAKAVAFELNHVLDRAKFRNIEYLGYESSEKPSAISGLPRLYYDRSKPFTKQVKFYDTYISAKTIQKPKAYVIPQAWFPVIENLQRNGVRMRQLQRDTTIQVSVYHIEDFQTAQRPFEGHYLHTGIKVSQSSEKMNFRKGDYIISMDQEVNRYIIEVLEPESEDSFFAWNYFDTILQAKEGYSAYVFEDLAAEYLTAQPELKKELEEAKKVDAELAGSASAQLKWVHERSPWKEKEHNRYPIYRVEQ